MYCKSYNTNVKSSTQEGRKKHMDTITHIRDKIKITSKVNRLLVNDWRRYDIMSLKKQGILVISYCEA